MRHVWNRGKTAAKLWSDASGRGCGKDCPGPTGRKQGRAAITGRSPSSSSSESLCPNFASNLEFLEVLLAAAARAHAVVDAAGDLVEDLGGLPRGHEAAVAGLLHQVVLGQADLEEEMWV